MNSVLPWLRVAGAVQLILVAGNFLLPGRIRLEENLARVDPIVGQIFRVHHHFISMLLVYFAVMCLFFGRELAGGGGFARGVCGFMAVFWTVRVPIQIFYYDTAVRKANRGWDILYTAAFVSLASVFWAACLGGPA